MDDISFNTHLITLELLANSVYRSNYSENKDREQEMRELKELNFYRKRVFNIMKEMLRGNVVNETLKEHHDNYVREIINYLKIEDRNEIIQREYNNISETNKEKNKNDIMNKKKICKLETIVETIEDENLIDLSLQRLRNDMIFLTIDNCNNENKVITMDNYVERKERKTNTQSKIIFPEKKKINIMTDEFKTKGISKSKTKQKTNTIMNTNMKIKKK